MTTIASSRFEFRLSTETKRLIERAADLVGVTASDFARSAVEERVQQVLEQHMFTTVVPPDYYDDLLRALDAPASPNDALTAAAQRAATVVAWR